MELDAKIPAKSQAEGEQYVAKRNNTTTEAKAWGDFAMAALLLRDTPLAAWASLKAVDRDWQPKYVADAGVYLFRLGKTPEALELLNCSYAMGFRSPYLFEALALVFRSMGDNGKAKEQIILAKELAPNDPIIDVEHSLITTGKPPVPPPKPPDALAGCLTGLETHSQEVLSRLKARAEAMDRITAVTGDLSRVSGVAGMPSHEAYHTRLLNEAREQEKQARLTRTQYQQDPNTHRGPFSEAGYQTWVDTKYKMAVSTCLTSYFGLTHELLQAGLADFASQLTFWASVVRLDPQKFADEQRAEELTPGHPGEDEIRINGTKPLIVGEHDLTSWLDAQYGVDVSNLRVKSVRTRSACKTQACMDQVDRQECLAWKGLNKDWSDEGARRYLLAARNFDHVAAGLLRGANIEILGARMFAARTLKALRLHKSAPGTAMPIDVFVQGINMSFRSVLVGPHLTSDTNASSVPGILREQARWFTGARTMYEGHVGSEGANIRTRCEPVERRSLEQLAEEEWEAYRDMLRDRMKEDIEVETGDEFPCSGKVGPISLNLDLAKLGSGEGELSGTWEVKEAVGFTGKVDQNGELGGSIDVGHHYGPIAGEGEVTVISRINPRNGEEDRGFKLTGEAGFGFEVGKVLGADCYPATGSVEFYPRAFMEDAVAYLRSGSAAR